MAPRAPKQPKTIFMVSAWNGDHEIVLRLTRRQRFFVLACLLALIASGTGATLDGAFQFVKMLFDSGVL